MKKAFFLIIGISVSLFISCSINRMATNAVANVLAGSGGTSTVFTGDDDPQLVGDALPFALKMFEAILAQTPDHEALGISTGSAFIMYANGFIELEALKATEHEQKTTNERRAKKLYQRGCAYLEQVLEQKKAGLMQTLISNPEMAAQQLSFLKVSDVPLLYWLGAGTLAAYSLEPFDFAQGSKVPSAMALMARAYELNPDYNSGAIDSFYISAYGGLPSDMGGDKEKAKQHYELSLKKANGYAAGSHVALANAIALPAQDYLEFKRLMELALAVDVNGDPSSRMVNLIAQERAKILLSKAEELFFDLGDDAPAEDWGF